MHDFFSKRFVCAINAVDITYFDGVVGMSDLVVKAGGIVGCFAA